MKITEILWLQKILVKVAAKHNLTGDEVEQVFRNRPQYRFVEYGEVDGEHLYSAFGRTDAGRHVTVIFILKAGNRALIITARDMDRKERRLYGK